MLDPLTKQAYGVLGISQPLNTVVATITAPGAGRWKVWGTGYHILQDGLKVLVNSTLVINIAAAAANTVMIGPINIDLGPTDNIVLALAVATGVGGASGTIYAQRLCDHLSEHGC